jgi:hypothetical protein
VTPSGWSGIACSADGTKFVAVALNFPAGPIYFSDNLGGLWKQSSAPAQEWEAVASSASGKKLAAVADYPTSILVSTNSGSTWQYTSAPGQTWSAIASSANGSALIATVNGGDIYQSTNSGGTWNDTGAPASSWSAIASSADGNGLVAVVNGGGIYTWQSTPVPQLSITNSNGGIGISWLIPSMSFTLEENSNPGTANWTNVTVSPVLNLTNLQNQVVIPASIGSQFYRLQSQ